MKKPAPQASWEAASAAFFLRFPIPGSNGVHSMATIVTYAQNSPPTKNCVYIAYNNACNMLMMLYVRDDGRYSFTKEYAHTKKQFDVIRWVSSNARAQKATIADVQDVLLFLKETKK